MNNPLAQLNDIHEISTVDWWPLGWGWWLLIAVILLTIATCIWYWQKRKRAQKIWKQCRQELLSSQRSMGDISTVLKIACRHYIGDADNLHTLTGKPWLVHLNQQLSESVRVEEKQINLLANSMYQPADEERVEQYRQFALTWLQHGCPRRPNHV